MCLSFIICVVGLIITSNLHMEKIEAQKKKQKTQNNNNNNKKRTKLNNWPGVM